MNDVHDVLYLCNIQHHHISVKGCVFSLLMFLSAAMSYTIKTLENYVKVKRFGNFFIFQHIYHVCKLPYLRYSVHVYSL